MFAGVEVDEVAGRDVGPTAPAGELPFPRDYVGLETDVVPTTGRDDAVLAVDDAACLRGVEYLPLDRRVGSDRLDPVHRRGDAQLLVFEAGEQFEAEVHGVVDRHGGGWERRQRKSDDHKRFARPAAVGG